MRSRRGKSGCVVMVALGWLLVAGPVSGLDLGGHEFKMKLSKGLTSDGIRLIDYAGAPAGSDNVSVAVYFITNRELPVTRTKGVTVTLYGKDGKAFRQMKVTADDCVSDSRSKVWYRERTTGDKSSIPRDEFNKEIFGFKGGNTLYRILVPYVHIKLIDGILIE